MTFQYIDVDAAIARPGLRMVVVKSVPSPWGEAAKGIFHIKRIDWAAVHLVYDNDALKTWAGQLSGPVAIYDDEPPRAGWKDILDLAEHVAPSPALLPQDDETRADVLSLAEKFCGKGGLGWHRRLQMVHAGLQQTGGFSQRVAGYLAQKYGYDPARASENATRLAQLSGEFAARLRSQRAAGKDYYFDTLSAADIYSAAFVAMFKPLPEDQCAMHAASRAAFEWQDPEAAPLDPILIDHRDMMYSRHLELPLSL